MTIRKDHAKNNGFTLIELLVVIAVIGILAAIIIVGYGAWRKSAITAQVKSDLNGVASAMEDARNFGSNYPASIPSSFSPSKNVVLSGGGISGGDKYCVDGTSTEEPSLKFYIYSETKNQGPQVGTCDDATMPLVSTFAGSGVSGFGDGSAANAKFDHPDGLTADSSGNVYVADTQNNRIRKITPSGVVSTLAGSGVQGSANGSALSAQFYDPSAVAVDTSGNIYVADWNNDRIRKITSSGVVTTLAGSSRGFADGTGTDAKFWGPFDITIDSSGYLYVADSGNNRIRKVSPSGVVTTLAGSGVDGYADGATTSAKFSSPYGVAVDTSGNVYVADSFNQRIRKITPAGTVSTIAGSGGAGWNNLDGPAASVTFNYPYGVAVDTSGNIYVADTAYVRKIDTTGMVSTYAGNRDGLFADGPANMAQFAGVSRIVINDSGSMYVTDTANNRIRKIQ